MKTLLILRHAKSGEGHSGQADHERPLTKRGKRAAKRMGRLLRDEDLVPDRILSSTAKRARQTAKRIAKHSGYDGEIDFHRELYLAEPRSHLMTLGAHVADEDCVLVVGHNPGLESLVERLTGQDVTLPTAALVQVDLPISNWGELGHDTTGELVILWKPKDLNDL